MPKRKGGPSSSPTPNSPLLKFGVLTDIQVSNRSNLSTRHTFNIPTTHSHTQASPSLAHTQHAPVPDGLSFSGSPRYYRNALHSTSSISTLLTTRHSCPFSLNLGDTIDGKVNSIAQPALEVLTNVLDVMKNFQGQWHHVYGNHELYTSLTREILSTTLNIPFKTEGSDLIAYHSLLKSPLPPSAPYRFIFLDAYDLTVLGRTGLKRSAAEIYLNKNPNYLKGDVNSPVGLLGDEVRFVAFNGGYGSTQMEFLKSELDECRIKGQKAFVCGHQPFHPGSTNLICLTLNYKTMLEVIEENSDVILATFSGHSHWPGYIESNGIHHIVFSAVLESEPGVDTYAVVNVYEDYMRIEGFGDEVNRVLKFGKETAAGAGNVKKMGKQDDC